MPAPPTLLFVGARRGHRRRRQVLADPVPGLKEVVPA